MSQDFITKFLEPYEAAVEKAVQAKAHKQSATSIVNAIGILQSAAEAVNEALPAELQIGDVLTEEQVAALKELQGSPAQSDELKAKRDSIEAALKPDMAELLELDEATVKRATEAVAKHAKELQIAQDSKSKSGKSAARRLNSPIEAVMPDGKTRKSNIGDWTNIRWQLHDHANVNHSGIAKDQLDLVLPMLKAVDAGEAESVDYELVAGDGETYKVRYPAAA